MITTRVYYSRTGKDVEVEVCCKSFAHALNSGTDSEGYGPLIGEFHDKWTIGSVGELYFCPFCGAEARVKKVEA